MKSRINDVRKDEFKMNRILVQLDDNSSEFGHRAFSFGVFRVCDVYWFASRDASPRPSAMNHELVAIVSRFCCACLFFKSPLITLLP